MSVRRHNQKLLTDKPPTRSLTYRVKIIKHRLAGLGHGASEPVHLEGPHRVSCSATTALELARLIEEANTNPRRELLLLKTDRASGNRRRGLSTYKLCPNGLRRALTGQPGDLSIQSRDNRRQPLHPLCRSSTNRQMRDRASATSAAPLLGLLVPRGNVDYGEGVLIGPPSHAVVGKKEQVGLVDLILAP